MTKIFNCELMDKGLHFTQDCIKTCCAPEKGVYIRIPKNQPDYIFTEFQKKRENAINSMREMNIPDDCKGCIYIKEYDLDSPDTPQYLKENDGKQQKISTIVINHFKQCDCACIYCSQQGYLNTVSKPQKSEYYDLYPILKKFYKDNLIDTENLEVEFQGGSIAVLKEFHDLFELILKHGVKKISFFTNGLKFMPEIVKASKKCSVLIVCSVDSGTRETFKQLKTMDKYDEVMKNLNKYHKEFLRNNKDEKFYHCINSKYILIEGVNDNKDELGKYIEASYKAGANMCQLDMDFKKIMINKGVHYDVPGHYRELFDFFNSRVAELGMKPFVWEYTQKILDQGYFE